MLGWIWCSKFINLNPGKTLRSGKKQPAKIMEEQSRKRQNIEEKNGEDLEHDEKSSNKIGELIRNKLLLRT